MRPLILRLAIAVMAVLAALQAQAFETRAPTAWVYDMTNDTVLLDKNADEAVPPSSMSKLMTIELLFEALKGGRITMDTTFDVSTDAMKYTSQGGSTMYLQENDRPTVEDLIKGMVVNSGNDACTVVAEGLEGSEDEFARKMTARAAELGLTQSHFVNSSGWPDPGQLMSMHDLGLLAVHLITTYPDLYPYFAETEFNYKDRAPANANNRNPILGVVNGADGLKTGHTKEAGFGMVGSVLQGKRRIVFAFNGLATDKERAEEAERIANWAFREFAQKTLITKGTKVADVPVWLGKDKSVSLIASEDLTLLLPSLVQGSLPAEVVYSDPVVAPIKAGDKIANLVITIPNHDPVTVPLVAENAVDPAGFLARVTVAAGILTRRAMAAVGS